MDEVLFQATGSIYIGQVGVSKIEASFGLSYRPEDGRYRIVFSADEQTVRLEHPFWMMFSSVKAEAVVASEKEAYEGVTRSVLDNLFAELQFEPVPWPAFHLNEAIRFAMRAHEEGLSKAESDAVLVDFKTKIGSVLGVIQVERGMREIASMYIPVPAHFELSS